MDFLDKMTGKALLFMIGIASAFVGVVVHKEITTFWQRITYFIGGVICTMFLTTPTARFFDVVDLEYISLIGFGWGVFGMGLLARTKAQLDNWDVISYIRDRILGGSK